MSKKTIQLTFFSIFTVGLSIILFFVFKPYLGVIFIAGVFAITFYPLYRILVDKFSGRENIAALTTTLLIVIFIILPIIIVSTFLLKETVDLYNTIVSGDQSTNIISQLNSLVDKINTFGPTGLMDSRVDLGIYARDVLDWIIGHFDSIFATVFGGLLNFILMILSLFYLFIYGDKIRKGLIIWSPLPDQYDEEFMETLRSSINAVLRGRILVALVQGIFIGIGFVVFGVSSPVLWGFVGGLASLVPIVGTSLVTIPAVFYLLLTGHLGAGIGLFMWGAAVVGLVDNVVSVIFFKDRIKVHSLVVLFSILGGVELFGAIGFLVGPVIVSVFIALMKIYPFVMSYKDNQPTTSLSSEYIDKQI